MSMPDKKSFAAYVVITVAIVGVVIIAWRLAYVFALAFGGIVLAAILGALADRLRRVAPLSERWGVVVVVVLLLVGLGLTGWLFGSQVANQFEQLGRQLPPAAEKLQNWLQQSSLGRFLVDTAHSTVNTSSSLSSLTWFTMTAVEAVTSGVLIFFLGLYFAIDPRLYLQGTTRLVPPPQRPHLTKAIGAAEEALRQWVFGQLIAMMAVGLLTGLGLWLLGVPLALGLALVMGLAEFVPLFGPIMAAVPGILMAFTKGPTLALYALLLYVAIQQVEGNLITPLIQRWAVALPPALGLLSIVAFGLLFGTLGIFFATPITVVILVLVK